MINEKPIFFAFAESIIFLALEPKNLTIFDLDGNKVVAPDWEYAEQFCDFY